MTDQRLLNQLMAALPDLRAQAVLTRQTTAITSSLSATLDLSGAFVDIVTSNYSVAAVDQAIEIAGRMR
jgi:hypothetical protein